MNKEKISIEISGYLRTFLNNIENWKENLIYDNNYEYYFFINTYNNFGHSKGWIDDIKRDEKLNDYFLKIIKENFENVDIFIEEDFGFILEDINENEIEKHDLTDIKRVLSMFRKIYKCNQQKKDYEIKNEIKFNYSIRIRPDLMFTNKINLFNFIKKNDENFIIINNLPWEGGENFTNHNVYNDQFCFGNNESVNLYSDIFLKIKDYCKYCKLHPESLLYYHLNNIDTKIFKEDIKFFINRNI
jgi:hypothetical protein